MPVLDKFKVYAELRRFNQRKLEKGEMVLLAQALSTVIPCIPNDIENPRMYLLNYSALIERVSYSINDYAYIDSEMLENLKDYVCRFLLWKTDIANGKLRICFGGETDVVIDELSGLPRYFDKGTLCSIADIAISANWLLETFKNLVDYEASCLVANKGGVHVAQ